MTTVAVLRGGVGDEHDVSLKTGFNVIKHLERNPYKPIDVYIDRAGVWHVRGAPMVPSRALAGADVVFNALHGQYGEDGSVQRELDRIGLPYTGSGALPSAIAMNKVTAKEMLVAHGIRMPRHITLGVSSDLEKQITHIFRTFPQPSVIKPVNSGSSVGVTIAKSFHEFWDGIKNAFQYSKEVMVEEYVLGREATVGVVDNMRGKKLYTLPPIEVIPAVDFYDYDAKYISDATKYQCPGNFTRAEIEKLEAAAATVHDALGLRHYSRSDFIVSPRGTYFLETNTLPGLTDHSLLPKSLDAVGMSMDEFLDHIIKMALERK